MCNCGYPYLFALEYLNLYMHLYAVNVTEIIRKHRPINHAFYKGLCKRLRDTGTLSGRKRKIAELSSYVTLTS